MHVDYLYGLHFYIFLYHDVVTCEHNVHIKQQLYTLLYNVMSVSQ